MNKQQLLELLDSLNLPKTEYFILSGGSLVIYGLKDCTNDLDLGVSEKLFDQLKEKYHFTEKEKSQYGTYHISEEVEIILIKSEDFKPAYRDGYPVETLEEVLLF